MYPEHSYFEFFLGAEALGRLTRSLGTLSMDHVFYKRSYRKINPFSFCEAIGLGVWILFVFSLIFIIAIQKIIGKTKFSFTGFYLKSLITVAAIPPQLGKILPLTWLIARLFLVSAFAGDMFSLMNRAITPDVIDSLFDLYKRKETPIAALDASLGKKRLTEYFDKNMYYYEELTKRLSLMSMSKLFEDKFVTELMRNTSEGKAAFLGIKCF